MSRKHLDGGKMTIRAALQGDLASLQVLDPRDAGGLCGSKIEWLAGTACQQVLGLQAGCPPDQRGQVALVGEIELVVGKALIDRRAGALEECPFDLDVRIVCKFLLQVFTSTRRGRRCALRVRPVIDADCRIADMNDERLLS
ncbi:hypothetical protein AJ87_48030 [Rhizobium yanglingense]|nr:hypothetical protein AJ87_48030 [Rhizobium yanglingense]